MGQVSLLDVNEKFLSKIAEDDKVKARVARVGSRIRWAEEGDPSTRFFLHIEKQRGVRNWITAMHRPDGILVKGIASICLSWVDYYSTLFSACAIHMYTLTPSLFSCLSDAESNLCQSIFSLPEVSQAL